ncbi:MAG: TolC family protein [Spirosomataceae bacterium]
MKKWILSLSFFWMAWSAQAQERVGLSACYEAARSNYPLLKQKDMQAQIAALQVLNLQKVRQLPQLTLNGQASWQNEVTQIPISLPNLNIESLSRDQYRLTLDASYLLFDGQASTLQAQVQQANGAVEQQKVEVELRKLNDQVNAYFLSSLLMDENIALTQVLMEDLKTRMTALAARVKLGTGLQTSVDVLEAEWLKADQRLVELQATRKGFRAMLALLTGLPIGENTTLELPEKQSLVSESKRPELQLFALQKGYLDAQTKLIENKRLPRVSAFLQTGIGRPSLNVLSNEFRPIFIGGLRLNWAISNLYTSQNEKSLLQLNRQLVDSQYDTFNKVLGIQLQQQQTEIEKWQGILAKDQALVAIRTRIKNNVAAQLESGVATATEFVNELNAENQAKINQKIHEFQLLTAQINYNTLTR